ncbi:MAG: HEAT repeat domain-containing protein [Bryobacterales bacterium]|nr:HEAT repeat domain-containing protein [Bryobacterales bacterium]
MMTVEYIGIRPVMTRAVVLLAGLVVAIGILAILSSNSFLCAAQVQVAPSVKLLDEFHGAEYFWQQQAVGEKIIALGDKSVLERVESGLSHEDRHYRGNVAMIFAGLGDDRGWEVLSTMLTDRSDRPIGQGIPMGIPTAKAQIASDRYFAVHLIGVLKNERAIPLLTPLLGDPEVNYKVVWALGEIGSKTGSLLIKALDDPSANVVVIAIGSLKKIKARHALPRLRTLLDDDRRATFGSLETVSEAAQAAIAALERP